MDPETAGRLRPPPRHFDAPLKAAWREIVKSAPKGVITQSDRFALEIACHLLIQFRADPAGMPMAKVLRLEVLLGKFGMTPADRARVASPGAKPSTGNPFADL